MAEISREEAHKILDIFLDKQVDLERTIHHSTYTDNEIWSAVKRAYDDMEKLQKIEEVIASMEYTDDEVMESFAFREVAQIVEEVER